MITPDSSHSSTQHSSVTTQPNGTRSFKKGLPAGPAHRVRVQTIGSLKEAIKLMP